MAQLQTSTVYIISPQQGTPNTFIVGDGNESRSYVITNNNPLSTQFEVGEALTYSTDSDPPFSATGTYLGHGPTGILLNVNGTEYYFSNSVYQTGNVISIATEPFPVCFVKGTRVTTSRGPIAIENLVEGDSVQGSTGWRTVKWVGWRNYGPASFFTQESKSRIAPIRIRAHSIADNVPSSDLLTSPWHHLFVDGKLVRAGDLVNGTTITQETHVNEVSYYHVELDQFDVVMAHGVYSESYADGGNRDFFQNVEVTSLRPEDKIRRRASRPGFDHLVLRQGKELVAIQDRIAQRAKAIAGIETQKQKVA
jgi:hypothetical protein